MPELPEVEHAAITLRRWLTGRPVLRAEASPTRVFRGTDPTLFANTLVGRTLQDLSRRGKNLLFTFDGDVGMTSHLGMSGRWVRRVADDPPPIHGRALLVLSATEAIHYIDPRMFGRIAMAKASELDHLPDIAALGPDALTGAVDAHLRESLPSTNRSIKVALMDQTLISGLGNILVTEALFRARIHPERLASSLDAREIAAIARGIREAIDYSLSLGDGDEDELAYLSDGASTPNPFLVYDRGGAPCPQCGAPLTSSKLGGRTTAFCPRCQPSRPQSKAPR